ncbi:MAG: type II toxin-antitoxin system CcdA family antitoxin [Xenococcaceae cyanobacterium]|nr:type II toxin-antitoxin system CcdA family antitoxin [Xenococcaceae cyanobacterium MO_188.B29]
MNNNAVQPEDSTEKVEVSIHLDSEVLEQIRHLTNDPSKIIETAIKQWLRGEREMDEDLTRTFRRNPPLPPKGEWND